MPDTKDTSGADRPSHAPTASGGWAVGDDVVVHIGQPKTGTTALQSRCHESAEVLGGLGVLYPATAQIVGMQRFVPNHVPAANAPLRWPQSPEQRATSSRLWQDLVASVRAHPGMAFVSAENLVVAEEEMVERIVEELGGARVRVVVTTRPVPDLLASFWQNDVRLGLQTPFDEWCDLMARGPGGDNERAPFWLVYEIARTVERWARVVGDDRVSVVLVDRARPDRVFRSFETLLGLPVGTLEPDRGSRSNRSLTLPEAEFVRRLNTELAGASRTVVHPYGAQGPAALSDDVFWTLLAGRQPSPDEPRIEPSADVVERLRPWADGAVERLRRRGVRIDGDLDVFATGVADASAPVRTGAIAATPIDTTPIDTVPIDTVPIDTVPIDTVAVVIEHLLRRRAGQR